MIAIILSAVYSLGKKALKNITLGILGGLTLLVSLLGVNEIIALFSCGAAGIFIGLAKQKQSSANSFLPVLLIPAAIGSAGYLKIFLTFLKVGALLYGSGYVLFAFLDAELVMKGLITRKQLMDAVAVGQFTPGPVLSTATFIGWQLGGIWGAILATLGIFLPSFVFVSLLNPIIPQLRKSVIMASFLDAVNIAAVAVIVSVVVSMSKDTLTDWRTIVIAIVSLAIVFGWKKLNSAFIVIGGAALDYLLWLV